MAVLGAYAIFGLLLDGALPRGRRCLVSTRPAAYGQECLVPPAVAYSVHNVVLDPDGLTPVAERASDERAHVSYLRNPGRATVLWRGAAGGNSLLECNCLGAVSSWRQTGPCRKFAGAWTCGNLPVVRRLLRRAPQRTGQRRQGSRRKGPRTETVRWRGLLREGSR